MPLRHAWNDGPLRLALWEVSEPEAFFDRPAARPVAHDRKRLEHLAGRYLLGVLEPGFPYDRVRTLPGGKPYLEHGPGFSVSHSGPYAAAAVCGAGRCGIDIELLRPGILRLRDKFLSPAEQALTGEDAALVTLCWSVKEAVFKWDGQGKVDFRSDIRIESWTRSRENERGEQFDISVRFRSGGDLIWVKGLLGTDFSLAYLFSVL